MTKRLFDLFLLLISLPIVLPFFLLVCLLVRIKLGSPIFFAQQRPGENQKIFTMYKFRTMTDDRYPDGSLKEDHLRLTRFGKLLRSTSLDELPELWNVLTGEMSLIGPRPLLVEYLPLYSPRENKRHDVKPGITGWAQVNGRNAILWEEKFKLDVWYVENKSMWLDIKILFLTIKKVFFREGISPKDSDIMPRLDRKNDHL